MDSCAIIGYQPSEFFFKYNEQHPLCQKIKLALLEQLKAMYERGVRRYYVGGALGTDMWAGEAVLSMKGCPEYHGIELICAIPFDGYNSRWDDESNDRLERLYSACKEVQVVSQKNKQNSYEKRYYYMINQSQFLIAICRGESDTQSDVEQAVSYAKKQGKEIIFIHPETAETTFSN